MSHVIEKILWAVDAFADKAQQVKAAQLLKALSQKSDTVIEPVMVLSPDQLKLPPSAFGAHTEGYRLEADKKLQAWMKPLKIKGLTSPTLLVSNKFSRQASVATLLSYAEQTGASLILLNTRAQKGLIRILLGSFAESLILHSRVPLLVLNPKALVPKKIRNILFTSDLTPQSRAAFLQVVELAKTTGAKVTLYHKVEYVVADTYSAIHQSPVYEKYLEEDAAERKKQISQWITEGEHMGVKITAFFDEKPGFISDSILKVSKKLKTDMIAVASHASPAGSVVLGSVARQIVRDSRSPIWVVHTK